MNDVQLEFKHQFFTRRVPLEKKFILSEKSWRKEIHGVEYGTIVHDEFRSSPDVKEFQYVNRSGDRLRYCQSRLKWKPSFKYLAVCILKKDTDLTYSADRPWKDVAFFPLAEYSPDSLEFKMLLLQYQKIAAYCDENEPLLKHINGIIKQSQIEEAQNWLADNYKPSKEKLRELQEYEFMRFVTFFDTKELHNFMKNPKCNCLHWHGTKDYRTQTAMFKRSTKLSGMNVRRNVNVKELMYQFLRKDLGNHEAMYLDFEKCKHRSKCVNPWHYIVDRKAKYNASKRRLGIKEQSRDNEKKQKQANSSETK